MPDWSYHPLFRPLLFRLPAEFSRDLTLMTMGTLATLPLGPRVIETLGHMAPSSQLRRTLWNLSFPTPVGLGAGLDVHMHGLSALQRFGFGFLEIGPVTVSPLQTSDRIERRTEQKAIWHPDLPFNEGVMHICNRLARLGPLQVPVGIRLAHRPRISAAEAAIERSHMIEKLAPYTDFFVIDTRWQTRCDWSQNEWTDHLHIVMRTMQDYAPSKPLLLGITADLDPAQVEALLGAAVALGIDGVSVSGGIKTTYSGRLYGTSSRELSLQMVHLIRQRWGPDLPIIGSGGIHQPEDALRMFEAGATLVQIHSGLVFSGPGLPKRINEAISYYHAPVASDPPPLPESSSIRLPQQDSLPAEQKRTGLRALLRIPPWIWMVLLSIGMMISGALAWFVAATQVVLPYDEAFLGISREDLPAINERLLSFMRHDRVTLAGTMITIGIIYGQLAIYGLRNRLHWARQVLLISGSVGFASFFLFLGYGYFDPLHAAIALLLFPLFLLGIRQQTWQSKDQPPPNLVNDRVWYAAQWGQLMFVIFGFGLTLAGLVISFIGVTDVFVPEDLEFLQTTPEALQAANPQLIPLIAHDRAGFGGALVSAGLGFLLTTLWGFRQGARWIWWTLLLAGIPGFVAGVGTHFEVGYTDLWHLSPAFLAFLLYAVGLILLFPYLCQQAPVREPDARLDHRSNVTSMIEEDRT